MAIIGVNGPTRIEKTDIVTMKNYSKTQIRMIPSNGSGDIQAGDTSVFRLPSAKIVDLATLRFNFLAQTNGDTNCLVGFPKYISSLIHQMEIWCNGQCIMNITKYNQIYNILRDFSSDYEKYQNKLFNNADPSIDYDVDSSGTGSTGDIIKYICTNETTSLVVNKSKKNYVIDDFIGFFDFSKGDRQSFLNTNLVGDFEIHITWATNKVLWHSTSSPNIPTELTYTISNLVGWIDTIDFKDDSFVTAQQNKLNSPDKENNVLRMPFKNYKSYLAGTNTGENAETTIRVVENTNSLDKLILTYLNKDRDSFGWLELDAGSSEYRMDNQNVVTATTNALTTGELTIMNNNIQTLSICTISSIPLQQY